MGHRVFILFLCWIGISCTATRTPNGQRSGKIAQSVQIRKEADNLLLENIMRGRLAWVDSLLTQRQERKIQIIYTQVDHPVGKPPVCTNHTFNLNPAMYFYPASTVKLPVALLALETINRLRTKGISKESMQVLETNSPMAESLYNDPKANDAVPRVSHWLKDIFLVSSNEAYNHLYNWLGADAINRQLAQKALHSLCIRHRLGIPPATGNNNRDQTSTTRFYNEAGDVLFVDKARRYDLPAVKSAIPIGKGYYKGDALVNEPMNFAAKNASSLMDLHQCLVRLIFPETVSPKERWSVDPADRQWLLELMRAAPRFSARNTGLNDTYADAYTKYLFYGGSGGPLNQPLEMYSKSGMAYGFLTDLAYFVDRKRNIDFFVSATIYVNSDEILNDDQYEYETVGLPFLKFLGQCIYAYEQSRPRSPNADWQQLLPGWEK